MTETCLYTNCKKGETSLKRKEINTDHTIEN